jgi:hypothetical protein
MRFDEAASIFSEFELVTKAIVFKSWGIQAMHVGVRTLNGYHWLLHYRNLP